MASSSTVTLPYKEGDPVGVTPGSRADGWCTALLVPILTLPDPALRLTYLLIYLVLSNDPSRYVVNCELPDARTSTT